MAILQVADQGPAESLALMLRSAGYECYLPDEALRQQLRAAGCTLVLSPRDLTRGMGYDPVALPEIGPEGMATCDLYCDVKAHRDYPAIVKRWPNLSGKVLWYRINGGAPEHVVKPSGEDCGDEVNPPCPVLTPNQWYAGHERAYACWPPFTRFGDYYPRRGRWWTMEGGSPMPPVCLVHNLAGWGYGALAEPLQALGVKCYGASSPAGLLRHADIPNLLSNALCMVHLKSSDAPGYALYEALAAACPVVCTRRLIWRCRMQELLIPGETCLVFDRETHEGLTPADVQSCVAELTEHLARLRDPAESRRLGLAGRERLAQVMWSEDRAEDVASLKAFLTRHYG